MKACTNLSNLRRRRAILSKEQAIQIFQIKLAADTLQRAHPASAQIASLFGISEKAVRDIWKGRTWARQTLHLDPNRLLSTTNGRVMRQASTDFGPSHASRHKLNLGQPSDVREPSINHDHSPDTSIDSPISAFATSQSGQQYHESDFGRRQEIVCNSIDYQLHEWSEGTLEFSELVDPFRLDWVSLAVGSCQHSVMSCEFFLF